MPPKFPPQFRGEVLRILLKTLFLSSTGLSPYSVFLSRKLQVRIKAVIEVLQHHISITLRQRIQFVLDRFQSLLLTVSRLISFPAGTKTLQFPAFPGSEEPSKREVSFGNLWFKAYVKLAKAYRSLSRPSSAFRTESST